MGSHIRSIDSRPVCEVRNESEDGCITDAEHSYTLSTSYDPHVLDGLGTTGSIMALANRRRI